MEPIIDAQNALTTSFSKTSLFSRIGDSDSASNIHTVLAHVVCITSFLVSDIKGWLTQTMMMFFWLSMDVASNV